MATPNINIDTPPWLIQQSPYAPLTLHNTTAELTVLFNSALDSIVPKYSYNLVEHLISILHWHIYELGYTINAVQESAVPMTHNGALC